MCTSMNQAIASRFNDFVVYPKKKIFLNHFAMSNKSYEGVGSHAISISVVEIEG